MTYLSSRGLRGWNIRWNTLKGLALGSERFKDEIEAALHRKVRPGKAGRPRNARLIS
jgi:hypothetical protein